MANGSEHMVPHEVLSTEEASERALRNLREKLGEPIPTIVYYPSPLGNLQECTRCKLILTGGAERCPVCGGVVDPTGEGFSV